MFIVQAKLLSEVPKHNARVPRNKNSQSHKETFERPLWENLKQNTHIIIIKII